MFSDRAGKMMKYGHKYGNILERYTQKYIAGNKNDSARNTALHIVP